MTRALVFALILALPASAFAGKAKIVDKVFARLDADKDGRISREEAKAGPRLAEHFDAVDADKDGFVTRKELGDALDKLKKQRSAG